MKDPLARQPDPADHATHLEALTPLTLIEVPSALVSALAERADLYGEAVEQRIATILALSLGDLSLGDQSPGGPAAAPSPRAVRSDLPPPVDIDQLLCSSGG